MNTDALTDSQRQVFDQLVQGKTNMAIATALGRAEATVKAHVTAIFKKLGCTNRGELIARHHLEQS